jgi:hypothetical protein
MRFRTPPPISIPLQVVELRRCFSFGEIKWDRRHLTWRGDISPDEFSRVYSITLSYKLGGSPEVFVRTPNLQDLAGGRSLPHVYDQKTQHLCLFVPGTNFWTPHKLIGSTVMLWACLWLRYFELWLVTDVWHGPGEHPAPENSESKPSLPAK